MKKLKILTLVILVLFLVSCITVTAKTEAVEKAEQKLMSLSQVKKGSRGNGLTVFKGENPQKFSAEIIGIWEYFGVKFIEAKISGGPQQILDKTLVIGGMSGSPIYVKGKLIGALSRSFINQREAKCLITPIEDMLRAGENKTNFPAAENTKSSDKIAPITVPISNYGFSSQTIELIRPFFKERGLNFEFEDGDSGGAKETDATQLKDLKPGDAIAVELMGGDFGLYGVGTVTYIYGNRVYAFGHGMFKKDDNINLPFYKASILDVIAAAHSFKLTEKILEPCLGSIKKDMFSAIIGILGAKPEMIPVSITLKDKEYEKGFNVRLPKKFSTTDILALMAIINAITLEKADIPEATIKLDMKITIKDVPTVSVNAESGDITIEKTSVTLENSTLTTTDKQGLGNSALTDFYMLLYCELKPLLESSVEVNFEKIEFTVEISERKVFEIQNAIIKTEGKTLEEKWSGSRTLRLIEKSLKPGDTVELNLLVKEIYTGQDFLNKFNFVIPENAPNGRTIIIVVNGKWLCWLLSRPEFSLGKDLRAAKDIAALITSVTFNNNPDPDKFYIIWALPIPKTNAPTETEEGEEEQSTLGWKPIKREDLGKIFPTSQLMITEFSPNLGGETRGLFQFVLQIESPPAKSQPDKNHQIKK